MMELNVIAPIVAGALVSYGLEFIPLWADAFHNLSGRQRAAIVAALTALVVVVLVAAECGGILLLGLTVECGQGVGVAVRDAVSAWLVAMLGGQGAHLLAKRREPGVVGA